VNRPTFSVVLPVRWVDAELGRIVARLLDELGSVGGELVVAQCTGSREPVVPGAVTVLVETPDLYLLRARGVLASTGDIVAIGEDHAKPRPGWAKAVLAAHERHPDIDVVVGAIPNASGTTLRGRANYLAFAAPWSGSTPELVRHRPPPPSTVYVKRRALAGFQGFAGEFETAFLNRWLNEDRMVADWSIITEHKQDGGYLWSMLNTYRAARASYGVFGPGLDRDARRDALRHAVREMAPTTIREVRASPDASLLDMLVTAPLTITHAAGAVVGLLRGRGTAGQLV
jgi:hypothetical protein